MYQTSFETDFIRGGERVPTRQVPYRQKQVNIHVVYFPTTLSFQAESNQLLPYFIVSIATESFHRKVIFSFSQPLLHIKTLTPHLHLKLHMYFTFIAKVARTILGPKPDWKHWWERFHRIRVGPHQKSKRSSQFFLESHLTTVTRVLYFYILRFT